MIRVGETAPDVTLPLHNGETFRLSEQRDKRIVVLYFYPKDFTWRCTKEACSFRDYLSDLLDLGAMVIGISTDDEESHKRFARVYRLNFPLASDTTGEVSKLYDAVWFGGVWTKRKTFVIDKQGFVRGIFQHHIQIDKHRTDVLQLLEQLQRSQSLETNSNL